MLDRSAMRLAFSPRKYVAVLPLSNSWLHEGWTISFRTAKIQLNMDKTESITSDG